ncbi:hypothetical protein ABIB38_004311 [Massilia sp. UYP11]|uniref:hypothetical protein n=1 Tax=Massilia sp. UYP11 TaxID=1756385 RepID=UPI003D21AE34
MNNKNKTGLTRSENGTRYFAMKKEAEKSIDTLFNREKEDQSALVKRHLRLGTVRISIYNKVTKQEVDEVDITTPFIINAKVYDSTTGKFVPNNHVARYIRNTMPTSDQTHLDKLKELCDLSGLHNEYKFFETQFLQYRDNSTDWHSESEWNLISRGAQHKEIKQTFFSKMEARYEALTRTKFKLNAHVLCYLSIFEVYSNGQRKYCTDDYRLTSEHILNQALNYSGTYPKLFIRSVVKQSALKRIFGKQAKWSGYTVDLSQTSINQYEDDDYKEEDLNELLNYTILPRIHTDYSWLNSIHLESIPCALWVELFKLNNGIPPFLVPDDTIDDFTDEQLKEIVKHAPRIILAWNKPELFNLDVKLPITEVYPVLSLKQKCDQLTLVHLGFENRHLIPESLTCISSLEKAVESSTANLSEIYHLLSEELRIKHWKGFACPYNLAFIPDHRLVAADFEHLVVKTLFEYAVWTDTEIPKLRFEELHPILRRDPEKLFNTIVHLCEIGFDPQQTVEPHFYWKDRIEQIVLEEYEDFRNKLSSEVQNAIADCGMVEGCVININPKLAAEFRKILHYHKLQAKIPLKTDIPKKKNKI